jgi:hypothetical protein
VSIIHAITCSFVPRSGAGMSIWGPMNGMISWVYRRVTRSNSAIESVPGSQATPPFAPPYGSPVSAHFQLIHMASAATSPKATPG